MISHKIADYLEKNPQMTALLCITGYHFLVITLKIYYHVRLYSV
jgi:hypothetical protein